MNNIMFEIPNLVFPLCEIKYTKHYCPLKMAGVKNQINSVLLNHREH